MGKVVDASFSRADGIEGTPFGQATAGPGWLGGLGPAALVSLLFHLIGVLVLYTVLKGGGAGSPVEPTPLRAIELEIVKFAVPKTQDSSAPAPDLPDLPEQAEQPEAREPVQSSITKPHRDVWHPLPRTADRFGNDPNRDAKKFGRVLTDITCPRFIDPSDAALMDRCANQAHMRSKPDQELVGRMNARIEREAIRKGWAAAAVPHHPELEAMERDLTREAPGADVFGPWPWEKK